MNKIIITTLFFFFLIGLKAQDMATLFSDMPDSYLPQLETAWRKDLVDLYNSGKEARLQNMIGGNSELKKLTTDYLLLQTTEKSTVEMKLFPLVNNTRIICVVSTVYGPVPDSRVTFYSTDWEPLDAEGMFVPATAGWFVRDAVDKQSPGYLDAMARLDMELIHYQLNPETLTLTATYTTPQYLSEEEREKVISFIKEEPKMYTWDKYRFID